MPSIYFPLRASANPAADYLRAYFAAGYFLYHVVDKQVMFLPALAVWAIWLGAGIAALVEWLTRHIRGLGAETAHLFVGGFLVLALVLGIGLNWQSVSLHADRRTYDYALDLVGRAACTAPPLFPGATSGCSGRVWLAKGWPLLGTVPGGSLQ